MSSPYCENAYFRSTTREMARQKRVMDQMTERKDKFLQKRGRVDTENDEWEDDYSNKRSKIIVNKKRGRVDSDNEDSEFEPAKKRPRIDNAPDELPERKVTLHNHTHDLTVDHGCDWETERRDLRLTNANKHRRTNLRSRGRIVRNDFHSTYMQGTHYAKLRQCAKCLLVLPRAKFHNHAVAEVDRNLNGLNIRCRKCQRKKYSSGYLMDDGFIVDNHRKSAI
jgi:hypothetical protein